MGGRTGRTVEIIDDFAVDSKRYKLLAIIGDDPEFELRSNRQGRICRQWLTIVINCKLAIRWLCVGDLNR